MLKLLEESITSLPFIQDEAAYLAMTSKFENPFRDKLAFSLFTHYKDSDTNVRVCREWSSKEKDVSRVDIAIIKIDESPEYLNLIELKATNTQHWYGGFEGENQEEKRLNHIRHHIQSLVKQLYNLKKNREKAKVYGIFIGTHPTEKINEKYNMMVKSCYLTPEEKMDLEDIKIAYENTFEEEINACAKNKIWSNCKYNIKLHNHNPISIPLGEFYTTPISLLIYIIECEEE
jgi:hypothetical protein